MFKATFTADDAAPAHARAFVASSLSPLVCTKGALLAVSEIVTNVVVHDPVSTELTVSLAVSDAGVRMEVAGNGQNPAAISHRPDWPQPEQTTGRGLKIVNAISDRWGVESNESPTVWCEIAC